MVKFSITYMSVNKLNKTPVGDNSLLFLFFIHLSHSLLTLDISLTLNPHVCNFSS